MHGASLRLTIAILLFAAWVGWLSYQVGTTANPIVVSRPQILLAPIVIEAQVAEGNGPGKEVTVTTVHRGGKLLPAEGKLIISNLGLDQVRGWNGPDHYILPLVRIENKGEMRYEVVPPPYSPGFHPQNPEPNPDRFKPAIYPVTASTRAQLQEALKLRPAPGDGPP